MATAKKATAKKTTPAAKKTAAKKASPAKTSKKAAAADAEEDEDLEWMEIKKPAAKKKAVKREKLDLKPIKVKAKVVGKGRNKKTVKPTKMGGTALLAHVVEETGLARKDVKLVIETMVNTIKASIMPGGVGGAVIPGLLAVVRKDVKARKIPAIKRGTIVEKRPAPGSKDKTIQRFKHPGRPASVKPKTVKARAMLLSGTRRAVFGTV